MEIRMTEKEIRKELHKELARVQEKLSVIVRLTELMESSDIRDLIVAVAQCSYYNSDLASKVVGQQIKQVINNNN